MGLAQIITEQDTSALDKISSEAPTEALDSSNTKPKAKTIDDFLGSGYRTISLNSFDGISYNITITTNTHRKREAKLINAQDGRSTPNTATILSANNTPYLLHQETTEFSNNETSYHKKAASLANLTHQFAKTRELKPTPDYIIERENEDTISLTETSLHGTHIIHLYSDGRATMQTAEELPDPNLDGNHQDLYQAISALLTPYQTPN